MMTSQKNSSTYAWGTIVAGYWYLLGAYSDRGDKLPRILSNLNIRMQRLRLPQTYIICAISARHNAVFLFVPVIRVVSCNPVYTSSRETYGQTVSPPPSGNVFDL